MAEIKAHTEYLTITTDERYEMVHLTLQIEEIVRRSGIGAGVTVHESVESRAVYLVTRV